MQAEKSKAPKDLGHQVAKGGAILVLLRLSIRGIGLISTMILFRVLAPGDFGLVALAMVVVGLAEVMAEFGFDQNLLRDKHAVRADYDVAWTLTFLRGVIVATLLVLMAGPAASYLNEPRLTSIVYWLALAPLLDGVGNIGVVDFSKELQFGKEYTLKVSQKVCSFILTLIFAFALRNYWALVIGILTGKVAGMALSYGLHPYRPRFSLKGARRVFAFSFWIFLNQLVLYAGNQTDKILIQKYYDATKVGIFRVAEEVCSIVMELVWPVERALFAGYAKLSDDFEQLRRAVLNSTGLVAMLGVPMSLIIMLVAEPAVVVLLGERGRAAAPFVQVLVLHGAIRSCFAGAGPAFMVLGKPQINMQITLFAVAVRLSILFTCFPVLGVMVAPWSLVAGSCVSFLTVWVQLKRHMRLRWRDYPRSIWRTAVAAGVMCAVVKGVGTVPAIATLFGNDWIHLLIAVPLACASYLLSLALLWRLSGAPVGPETQARRLLWNALGRAGA